MRWSSPSAITLRAGDGFERTARAERGMNTENRWPVAYCTVVLAGVLVVAALLVSQLLTLLLAALITVIIAIPLASGAEALQRRGVPRALGALLTLLLALGVLGGVMALIVPSFVHEVNTFVDNLP